jgi:hypothetical protein
MRLSAERLKRVSAPGQSRAVRAERTQDSFGGHVAELKYSMLGDDWLVGTQGMFESPLNVSFAEQRLLFSDRIKNGWISADITPLDGAPRRSGEKRLEAGLVCRYAGSEFYYAGTGAWGTKFFIAKANPGPFYQLRQYVGRSASVVPKKTYRLRLEFNGSQMTLFENDVQQLILRDEGLQIGQCGLHTFSTKARFENVLVKRARPRAFVVMPFTSELDYVHRVIRDTIESYDIDCIRADEIFLSRPIMDDVKTMIAEADIVIVDFTGKNPNVYYEAGLADAWKKDWIILAQSTDDMTFDVRHIRSIRYSNTMGADQKLEANLRGALEGLGYGQPTLKSGNGVETLSSATPVVETKSAPRAKPKPAKPKTGESRRPRPEQK